MPVTFDFNNGGAAQSTSGGGVISVSNTDDGVNFTLSSIGSDTKKLVFGNGGTDAPILIMDSGTTRNAGRLEFSSTANTVNTVLSGTTANPIQINVGAVSGGPWRVNLLTVGGGVVGQNLVGTNLIFSGTNLVNGITFTPGVPFSGSAMLEINSITANELNCFCEGTRIATSDGYKLVEDLEPGDRIRRADGGETQVKWLGRQFINTKVTHPLGVNPIRISAGALGQGLPEQDLRVSAEHAIGLDGVLINAGALINGETIAQEADMPIEGFTYHHIETEAHELILAEGLPAESFLDCMGRRFDNVSERSDQRSIAPMDVPRISAARLLPQSVLDRIKPRRAA